ncbi:MAG: transketolase [Myxococcota bacterium]
MSAFLPVVPTTQGRASRFRARHLMWTDALRTRAAHTLRMLAIDAVNEAKSGHPGAPMGLADLAVVLFGEHLNYDPSVPHWANRDRFVLSNGHASMLQYGALHLCGYGLSLEDLKAFRQLGSRTAGHPEYGLCPGVETTTGPLGQGFANAVGMALGGLMIRARLGTAGATLMDHQVYVILGDGCMMEGVTQEAASMAGHLGLSNLIAIYDDNGVTIDGRTDLSFSEDVPQRFQAMGWQVLHVDGHDQAAIKEVLTRARKEAERPVLVVAKTHIGWGSPNRQDTAKAHGEPLGAEETDATRAALGWNEEDFHVPADVKSAFEAQALRGRSRREAWTAELEKARDDASFAQAWRGCMEPPSLPDMGSIVEGLASKTDATRGLSGAALNALALEMPQLVGGSADLTGSNKSAIKDGGVVRKGHYEARNLHYGIREHAMGAICNGLARCGTLIPFGATFLAFSDYMRPPIRLAGLMKLRALTVFTHDSIGLGEDGPTHQPVEQLWALRLIPKLYVWRPADGCETAMAWAYASTQGEAAPHALVFTRQKLPPLPRRDPEGVWRGGYVVHEPQGDAEAVVIATGSEVSIALEAAQASSRRFRVVSMPCLERFLEQPEDVQQEVLPPSLPVASLEAGRTDPWALITGRNGLRIGIDSFGESAPYQDLYVHFGLDAPSVQKKLEDWLA